MISESARATARAEGRFRIDAPNSQPRAVKVIALDAPSEVAVKHLAQKTWNRAAFLTASAFAAAPRRSADFSVQGWLVDLAGRTKNLIDEIATADLVVMIATAGENAQAAALVGEACVARNVMTTGLVRGARNDDASAQTSAQLRPHVMMLVVANSDDYIEDMLTALRA